MLGVASAQAVMFEAKFPFEVFGGYAIRATQTHNVKGKSKINQTFAPKSVNHLIPKFSYVSHDKMLDPRSPIAAQISLYITSNTDFLNSLNPKKLSLLAADFPTTLIRGNIDLIPPTIRRRGAIESDHRIDRLRRTGQINKTIALTGSRNCHVAMKRQDAFAHCLDVVAFELLPHFLVDEGLIADVAETSYV